MTGTKKICPYHKECPFFNLDKMTSAENMLKKLYCLKRYDRCEIYKRYVSGRPIPRGMQPNGNIKI